MPRPGSPSSYRPCSMRRCRSGGATTTTSVPSMASRCPRIADCHVKTKQRLLDEVARHTPASIQPQVLTLGFARCMATYNAPAFSSPTPSGWPRWQKKSAGCRSCCRQGAPGGPAGKGLIREVFAAAAGLKQRCQYPLSGGLRLGAGRAADSGSRRVGQYPAPSHEASGTSGMKAALNGVPSLSVLDGWWIEGCAETYRMGHRDRRRGGRGCQPLRQAGEPDRPAVPRPHAWPHAAALHRCQWHLLQHPPHVRPVPLQRVLPADLPEEAYPEQPIWQLPQSLETEADAPQSPRPRVGSLTRRDRPCIAGRNVR